MSQTVSPGTNNVVLMRGTVTVKNPVTLEDLALTLNNNPSSDLVDRVSRFTLRIGNSSSTWTPSTTDFTTGTFDGAFTVNSSATFEITADIKTNATGGSIQFSSLEAADFNTVEYVNTQNSAKGSSVGSIASAIVTITPSTLNLTRTDGLSARSVVAGAQDVVLFGGRFSTTQNGSITINSFNLSGTASTAAFNDNVNTTLYVNGQSVRNATLRNGIINFNSLNIPVSKTAAANFEIKASINQ